MGAGTPLTPSVFPRTGRHFPGSPAERGWVPPPSAKGGYPPSSISGDTPPPHQGVTRTVTGPPTHMGLAGGTPLAAISGLRRGFQEICPDFHCKPGGYSHSGRGRGYPHPTGSQTPPLPPGGVGHGRGGTPRPRTERGGPPSGTAVAMAGPDQAREKKWKKRYRSRRRDNGTGRPSARFFRFRVLFRLFDHFRRPVLAHPDEG